MFESGFVQLFQADVTFHVEQIDLQRERFHS